MGKKFLLGWIVIFFEFISLMFMFLHKIFFVFVILFCVIGITCFVSERKQKDKTSPEERLRKAERKTNKILKSCGIDTKELEDKTAQ